MRDLFAMLGYADLCILASTDLHSCTSTTIAFTAAVSSHARCDSRERWNMSSSSGAGQSFCRIAQPSRSIKQFVHTNFKRVANSRFQVDYKLCDHACAIGDYH